MPPLPGEERMLTVFADIHYYFSTPTPKPLHHRFDKGSYFYIYHNATRQTVRLEVANHPGTPDQDAFNGYLDGVRFVYSYKFPTLLTLVVDPADPAPAGPQSPQPGRDQEWRLTSSDPRDPGNYMYRLHTLDIYFWTLEDTRDVIEALRLHLHPSQLDIMDALQQEDRHHEDVSPVVKNLENVAISDPAYANGQTRNSQNQPTQLPPVPAAPAAASPNHDSQASNVACAGSIKSDQAQKDYTPMAYNPAAPAAPEPIAHREKTPPPPDAADGTGLAAAALADHAAKHTTQPQPYTGIPGQAINPHGHYGSSPPQGQATYTAGTQPTMAHNPSVSSTASSHRETIPSAFAPPPSSAAQAYTPAHSDPTAQSYGGATSLPLQSPGAQFYGSQPYGGHRQQPLQHVQPQYADYLAAKTQAPPGGYTQYSYDPRYQQQQDISSQYDIHNQVYRPTEAEVASHGKKQSTSKFDGGYKAGKLEEKADKAEKTVNKFLKKLEKKIG